MPISIYSVRSYSDKSLVYYGFIKQPLHKDFMIIEVDTKDI